MFSDPNVCRTEKSEPHLGQGEALTFQYDTRLGLKTSFTGKDLLFTRMRAGNNDGDNFAEGLSKLDTAGKSGNTFYLDRDPDRRYCLTYLQYQAWKVPLRSCRRHCCRHACA